MLWGWCYEEQGAPPYWPWTQPIRSYIQDKDIDQLRSEMGPGAADIAEVVPQVRDKLPDIEPPPALEPESARFRLFDSIATFLKNASRNRPLVLILDDLHWADRSSLLLLEFLAHEIAKSRLLVVGAYRDVELSRRHPLTETLAELSRGASFQRVLLRGLDQQETERLIQANTEAELPQGLVQTVYSQTEGNPFFVTEIASLLGREGELWDIRIPEGVREVIGRRLNRLSELCNRVLTTASVIGREFDFKLLSMLNDLSEDQLLEVVEEVVSGTERYRFSHALIRQTLYEEITTSRRVRVYARIGEALEKLHRTNVEPHASELAYHFSEAEPVTGAEKMVRYSAMAGEQALAAYAWEEALNYFERTLAAKEGQAMDSETAALLFSLGRAQAATLGRGRIQEAVTTLGRTLDYYLEAGDVAKAMAIAEYPILILPKVTRMAELMSRALKVVPPGSHQAGRLLSRYCRAVGLERNDYRGSQEAFTRAMSIAQRENDLDLELRTLAESATVDRYYLQNDEALKKCQRAIDIAQDTEEPEAECLALFVASGCFAVKGDLGNARLYAQAMLTLVQKLRSRSETMNALDISQRVAALEGNWRAGREFVERGLKLDPGDLLLAVGYARLEFETGDFDHGRELLKQILDAMRASSNSTPTRRTQLALLIATIGRVANMTNHFDVVRKHAEAILSLPDALKYATDLAKISLALIAVQQGDIENAEEQYKALSSYRGETVGQTISIASDRLLGLLAHTMGNYDNATEHFEDSLVFCHNAGYLPELAWTCHDYADVLLQRNGPGDHARVLSLLDEAIGITNELGMRPLTE